MPARNRRAALLKAVAVGALLWWAWGDGVEVAMAQSCTRGWVLVSPSTSPAPSPRSDAIMVYDAAHARTLLMGGAASGAPLTDMWAWTDSGWTRLLSTVPFDASTTSGAAVDPSRGVIVVHVGIAGGGDWEWDGAAWTNVPAPVAVSGAPASAYPTGPAAAIAFDPARQSVVLFEQRCTGATPPSTDPDTLRVWERVGTSWQLRSLAWRWDACDPANPSDICRAWQYDGVGSGGGGSGGVAAPAFRGGASAAYDAVLGRTVLVGGVGVPCAGGAATPFGDAWMWDGQSATFQPQTGVPSVFAPGTYRVVFDDSRGHVFGVGVGDALPGSPGAYGPCQVWEMGGPTWTRIADATTTRPGPRRGHSVVYDSRRRRLVLFGGEAIVSGQGVGNGAAALGDLWEWVDPSIQCRADFNCDSLLSMQDIHQFVDVWFNSGARADFNSDGRLTAQDLFDFLSAWFAGC